MISVKKCPLNSADVVTYRNSPCCQIKLYLNLENERLDFGHGNLSYDFGAPLMVHRGSPAPAIGSPKTEKTGCINCPDLYFT